MMIIGYQLDGGIRFHSLTFSNSALSKRNEIIVSMWFSTSFLTLVLILGFFWMLAEWLRQLFAILLESFTSIVLLVRLALPEIVGSHLSDLSLKISRAMFACLEENIVALESVNCM